MHPARPPVPTGIPTQDRINLLRQGKIKEALELVLTYSPFPASVCGQVCPNLCKDACSRQFIDHPVAMQELGRLSQDASPPEKKPETGKKVAVIGGGPGGLSAAWQLSLLGHSVTLFEGDKEVGGKLRQAIPMERLPREILDSEVDRIKEMGADIQTSQKIDDEALQKAAERV